MKRCTKCHKRLSEKHFKVRYDGYLESWCHQCTYRQRKQYHQRYREQKAEERLAKYKEWRRRNFATYTLMILRKRSRDKGIPFNLDASDLMLPEVCPVLGIKLRNNVARARDNSPAVDRIVPSKGYVKGNVCVISQRANMLKSSATVDELEAVLRYMKSFPRA